jgi:SulP family sulfate permease
MSGAMNAEVDTARRDLVGDAWGGLAAMLVALPSAIAFGVTIYSAVSGSLAAEGALAGILGATALGLVAPFFGGSQRLITAPCAPAAAVLSALAITFAQQGVQAEASLLLLGMIGLLAGVIQIGLGLAGVGRLIKFIPFPVVSGYLSGVGLIIIGSQIPKLLGAPGGKGLLDALMNPAGWMWQSIVVGVIVIVTMVYVPRLTDKVPAAILALLAGVVSYLLLGVLDPALLSTQSNPLLVGQLGSTDTSLKDSIEQHWMAFGSLGLQQVAQVFLPALTLAALLSIDTLKTCVVIDAMTNSSHDSNRELVGQGLGNIASALAGGIPGAGTMGASLINISSGGRTRRAGTIAGALSLIAFLALTPLIAWVPIAALAGILIVIGFRMIDRHSLEFFSTSSTRLDFAVIMSVILVAIFGNLIAASGVGVALAIILFIREQTRSSVVRNRIEGSDIFSKHTRTSKSGIDEEVTADETVIIELQGSLFFGTANQLHSALEVEAGKHKYVILSMRRVQSLDVTATHVLEQIKDRLEENDSYLVFCDIPRNLPSGLKMKRFLKETGVVRPTNKAFAFRQLDEALEWVEARQLEQATPGLTEESSISLQDMNVFAGHDEAALAALQQRLTQRHVKAGKKVFKAGSAGSELYMISRGTVKLTVPLGKKESYHMATCGPGDIVGGLNFLDGTGHSADALAITDVDVFVLSKAGFNELAELHPALTLRIVKRMARNLAHRLRVAVGEVQALRG